MATNKMQRFWDEVNRFLVEYDVDLVVRDGRGTAHVRNLVVNGYIKIVAHGIEYRSFPLEHTVAWVSWKPYRIIGHFSQLTDPNATVEWVDDPVEDVEVVEVFPIWG